MFEKRIALISTDGETEPARQRQHACICSEDAPVELSNAGPMCGLDQATHHLEAQSTTLNRIRDNDREFRGGSVAVKREARRGKDCVMRFPL